MLVCDGCGAQADDSHIRARIERLELATRFRPIHIQTLLIDSAPPASPPRLFYTLLLRTVLSVRWVLAHYFDELMKCAGFTSVASIQEETALAEFQRRGIFLASRDRMPDRRSR